MLTANFKREQGPGIFHYYRVYGGPGKTKFGFQTVINLLNPIPIIHCELNDLNSLTGTWCQYEVGTPISDEEFFDVFVGAIVTLSQEEVFSLLQAYNNYHEALQIASWKIEPIVQEAEYSFGGFLNGPSLIHLIKKFGATGFLNHSK